MLSANHEILQQNLKELKQMRLLNGKQLNITSITKILTERELNIISSNLIAEFRMFGLDIQIPRDKEYTLNDLFNKGISVVFLSGGFYAMIVDSEI
mgnify:CR=1 FL=1